MSYETSKKFWKEQKEYPDYPNTEYRRLIDLAFVALNMELTTKSVLDLGCADGYLLQSLRFYPIEKFYGYDISKNLLDKIEPWDSLTLKQCDFTKEKEYPEVDLTISMGMFPYIFEQNDLYNILLKLKSNLLLVRAPCTLKEKDEYINKFSEELNQNYSCIYRTVPNYVFLFEMFYKNVYFDRSYPDDIESKYKTKHHYFVCKERI